MPVESSYIVSARKYRPTTFASVVGQKHVTSTLQNAIASNQIAQAFLFCGPRGVGKTTCARILAKTINCTNLTKEIEACNECESCSSFNSGSSLNIIELDAASNNSVDDIRKLVSEINIPPMNGKYKVYIIDEVHMLSTAAFNAFLKTLEEPPKYVKFILATTEKQKILPTILSRCQIFDFHRITVKDISEHLQYIAGKENVKYEKEALDIIAEKADGGLRDALSMFDLMVSFTSGNLTYRSVIDSLNILDYDYFFRFVDMMLHADISSSLTLYDEILAKGFQGDTFIDGLSNHLRNLLVAKDEKTLPLLNVPDSAKERYLQQSKNCMQLFLLRALNFANDSAIEYKSANNKRLCVELMLMKMCNIVNKLTPKTQAITSTTPITAEKKNSLNENPKTSDIDTSTIQTNQSEHNSINDNNQNIENNNKREKPINQSAQANNIVIDNSKFNTPFAINKISINKIKEEVDNTTKKVPFIIEDVEKYIADYAEKISKQIEQIEDSNNDNNDDEYDGETSIMEEDSIIEEENGYNSDIDIENTNNQKLINLYKALDTAKIKPYKDSPYVIEVYVQTMEDKNLIDNIKRSLTQDIMKDLGYPTFRIEVIDTSGESNKALPYSPIDKFNYFKKTTPAIELLRESFNADIKH